MTLKKHYWKVFWEIAMVFGAMMFIPTIYIQINGIDTLSKVTIWQITLLAVTLVFRGESLINFHNLEDHLMRLNYLVSSVFADISLLILLYYFLPGGKYFYGKEWQILGIYIVLKGMFYFMLHLQSLKSAKEINRKLSRNSGL